MVVFDNTVIDENRYINEKRELDSQIAFVEIFNEVDDHPFLCGIKNWGGNRDLGDDKLLGLNKFFLKIKRHKKRTLACSFFAFCLNPTIPYG